MATTKKQPLKVTEIDTRFNPYARTYGYSFTLNQPLNIPEKIIKKELENFLRQMKKDHSISDEVII